MPRVLPKTEGQQGDNLYLEEPHHKYRTSITMLWGSTQPERHGWPGDIQGWLAGSFKNTARRAPSRYRTVFRANKPSGIKRQTDFIISSN